MRGHELSRGELTVSMSQLARNEEALVKIQTVSNYKGITDIEISCGKDFFAVIEAKRGPTMPVSHAASSSVPNITNTWKPRGQLAQRVSTF